MGHRQFKHLDETGLIRVKSLEGRISSCVVALEAPTN